MSEHNIDSNNIELDVIETNRFSGLLESLYCSKCKVKTRIEYVNIAGNNDQTYFAIARCIDCERLTFFKYARISIGDTARIINGNPSIRPARIDVELIHTFPSSSEVKVEDVPENIKKSYLEGVCCLDSNAPNGAVSMFRRALGQICVDLDADSLKNLVDQISVLPKELISVTTEIRKWGNLGAHEDSSGKVVDVTNMQANSIKKFLEKIFLELYQHPAELERLQDERK